MTPLERVRRLAALVERGDTTLLAQIAEDLGLGADTLSKFAQHARADHGDLAAALEAARAELGDEDARCAAAADCRARSKTQDAARRLFNRERGEDLKWVAFRNLLLRAADRGLDGSTPAPPPPGQVIKGLSTMHTRDPDTGALREAVVWTKTTRDRADPADAIRRAADALRSVTRLPPIKPPVKPMRAALLNHIVVTDLHIGQESDPLESGAPWSLAEAERVACGCFDLLLAAAPPAETLLIAFLGDYLDFEGSPPQTFTSRHPLPNAGCFLSMVEMASRIARRLIDRGLQTHGRVVVAAVDGNHDPVSAIWLRHLLQVAYEREPRVSVLFGEPRAAPHCAWRFGAVMLGYAHQHLTKSAELPNLFRDTYRAMYGGTAHCHIHCGHLHHFKVETHGAVKVYQHPTLAAKSRHIARLGYAADRAMRLMTYHRDGPDRWGAQVTPEMLIAEPA
jgi:hypothetical protein